MGTKKTIMTTAVTSHHNLTCCFESPTPFPATVSIVVVFLVPDACRFGGSGMNEHVCTQLSLNFPDTEPGTY